MRNLKFLFIFCSYLLLFYACSKKDEKVLINEIKFVQPTNFPNPVYQFEGNALSRAGFELGKKLFYDVRLSSDQTVSCGSCHQQFAAFAQLDHPVSHGVDNCLGKRNAPVLFNLAWQREFLWDGGAKNLEVVPLNAINDACEMGTNIAQVVKFINSTSPYPAMFQSAFGSPNADSQKFLKALAQFMATMVSANSKYDQVMRKEGTVVFTSDEQQGYMVFKEKCAQCHTEPLFTDLNYKNNGLDLVSIDEGRMHITEQESDRGKFKVPTLRNVALSAPYMHDGRFNTLEQVLDHYHSGIKINPNLAPILKNGIALSAIQKQQIIKFLQTLTDNDFIKNKEFSEY